VPTEPGTSDLDVLIELMDHAGDFTLMPPQGGDTVHGFDDSDEAVAGLQAFFRSGDVELEVHQTYASGDLAVLVAFERQHGQVGDHPPQDLSLRLTLVFRRDADGGWHLVHRHADPLVHPITFDHLLALARGEQGPPADDEG
jgi:ketosteroid isomerase-like protein